MEQQHQTHRLLTHPVNWVVGRGALAGYFFGKTLSLSSINCKME